MQLNDLKEHVDLFPYSTLRIRSKARYFYEVKTEKELVQVIQFARRESIPFLVLGGGSNTVFMEEELNKLVIKNLYIKKELVVDDEKYSDIRVSSGYPASKLARELAEGGLQGLEYHFGLPGTVGGAIYMNSKWTNPICYFGDPLITARVLDAKGNVREVKRDYFKFAYDFSILQETGEILLDVTFRLSKTSPEVLRKRTKEVLEHRKQTQPMGVFSSGCFFQNITEEQRSKLGINTASAGNLIDKAGLKNYSLGNFFVSTQHANFIINKGSGDPSDLRKMLSVVKSTVKDKFNIDLKEEVVLVKN